MQLKQATERHSMTSRSEKNTFWSYPAMLPDLIILMLIRHDCVDKRSLGDASKAWVHLQQLFRSDETVTVVTVMQQLVGQHLKEYEAKHNNFIRAKMAGTCCATSFWSVAQCNGTQWLTRVLWRLSGAGELQSCRQQPNKKNIRRPAQRECGRSWLTCADYV